MLTIHGARRVGKTTLIHEFIKKLDEKYLFVTGEDINVQSYLGNQSIEKLKDFIGDHKILILLG